MLVRRIKRTGTIRAFTPAMANKKTTVFSKPTAPQGAVQKRIQVLPSKPVLVNTGLKEVSKGGSKTKPLILSSKAPEKQVLTVVDTPPKPTGDKMKIEIATNNAAVKDSNKVGIKNAIASDGEIRGAVEEKEKEGKLSEKFNKKTLLPIAIGAAILLLTKK